MATNKELQEQIEGLRKLLEQHGIADAARFVTDPTERADYIAFGSPKHAAFLGLVKVDDVERAKADGYIVYTSPKTDDSYRLEDQVTPFMHYPDPKQVAVLVLQQKVSSFEAPPPGPSPDAPPMWDPDLIPIR
jgi:predicted RNA binding protein with dsRBD fold (UPF0201 family)